MSILQYGNVGQYEKIVNPEEDFETAGRVIRQVQQYVAFRKRKSWY